MTEQVALKTQKDWKPTRKQFMGGLAGVLTAATINAVHRLSEKYPTIETLTGPELTAFIPVAVYFGIGYVMRERAD